jgi:spore germination protein GerM
MGIMAKNLEIERLAMNRPEIFTNKKVPAKTAYWLARLQKELEKLLKEYAETRQNLFLEHCLKNDDGTPKVGPKGEFQFASEVTQSILKEVADLANTEVEMPGINKIKINLDDKALDGCLSADDLIILEPFIEVEQPS